MVKKLLLALAAVLLIAGAAEAQPEQNRFRLINVWTAEPVASTAAVTSSVISLEDCLRIESLIFTASSAAGTADVKLEWMGCNAGTCEDAGNHTDIITASNTDFTNSAETVHHLAHPTHLSKEVQYKVTGTASNNADTVVTMELLCRNN